MSAPERVHCGIHPFALEVGCEDCEREERWLAWRIATKVVPAPKVELQPCCGAVIGDDHLKWHSPTCPDRCRYCGSEGPDLDHREGCPTIGTCAQIYPNQIELADAHPDPEQWSIDYMNNHLQEFHPTINKWGA